MDFKKETELIKECNLLIINLSKISYSVAKKLASILNTTLAQDIERDLGYTAYFIPYDTMLTLIINTGWTDPKWGMDYQQIRKRQEIREEVKRFVLEKYPELKGIFYVSPETSAWFFELRNDCERRIKKEAENESSYIYKNI